jgi:squalene-associated FAD-dependent desaturase
LALRVLRGQGWQGNRRQRDQLILRQSLEKSVTVLGGGVAGMSAACALADAGFQVHLIERRGYLGGRASSYLHPGVREVIDNCQHVLFGCCTNLIGFYKRIGVSNKIHWTSEMTMIEPGGRRSLLAPSRLPAPLHGLPRLLGAKAFSRADKLALARAFRALMRPVPKDSTESLGTWLKQNGQTPGAVERFWRLVIASALNADLDSIALPYAAKVIRELFMNSAEAGKMGMSTVPLSELYESVGDYLVRQDSDVLLNANVEAVNWDEETSEWILGTRAGSIRSEYLVLALPFEATQQLITRMPPAEKAQALMGKIAHHEHWPICSVHLWFDREITDLDHAVLLDRELHWMYNKSRLQPWRKMNGTYLELVVSASRQFARLERNEAISLAVQELGEFFPEVAAAKVVKAALIKEMRATFGVSPGIDAARPGVIAPWPQCFLAGDWTATGWPSTMESAARSGHIAAEALCKSVDDPRSFLEPDLKPKGFMRFLASS